MVKDGVHRLEALQLSLSTFTTFLCPLETSCPRFDAGRWPTDSISLFRAVSLVGAFLKQHL